MVNVLNYTRGFLRCAVFFFYVPIRMGSGDNSCFLLVWGGVVQCLVKTLGGGPLHPPHGAELDFFHRTCQEPIAPRLAIGSKSTTGFSNDKYVGFPERQAMHRTSI